MDTLNQRLLGKTSLTDSVATPLKLENIQTPEQILALIENPAVRDFVSLVLMAHGLKEIPECPKWVASAAKELFNGIFIGLSPQKRKSENYRLGFILGLSRKLTPEVLKVEKQLGALYSASEFPALAQVVIQKEDDLAVVEFYRGYADGIMRGDDLSPSSTTAVYAIVTIKWQEMAGLKNVGQVQSWMENYLPRNLVGSRDRIAKICQKIRFPLTDKGGRPKSKPRKA